MISDDMKNYPPFTVNKILLLDKLQLAQYLHRSVLVYINMSLKPPGTLVLYPGSKLVCLTGKTQVG